LHPAAPGPAPSPPRAAPRRRRPRPRRPAGGAGRAARGGGAGGAPGAADAAGEGPGARAPRGGGRPAGGPAGPARAAPACRRRPARGAEARGELTGRPARLAVRVRDDGPPAARAPPGHVPPAPTRVLNRDDPAGRTAILDDPAGPAAADAGRTRLETPGPAG